MLTTHVTEKNLVSYPMAETTTSELESLMSDYTALWNGDFSKLDAVAESVDVYHHAAPDGEIHGREALEAFIREFHSGFPDFNITVDEWISSNGIVMKEWTMTGTHEGEFTGIPPTGHEIESTGMAKILVADGKVQEDRLYYNPQVTIEQLGLIDD
ncbi:ester cyclase [Natrinema sp. 1APR25-10V2]|uniref:ester cyclase n=1 Tax=Natrinema sp. 1APR25-10V2 TaxID=2951081 RepID=UPI00287534A1|nr:ester cyclase [Natrinema sp. 1APR25-10V2]MDS0476835.1 ester cyclase [Natrinema sp. 1APR25-10V2]